MQCHEVSRGSVHVGAAARGTDDCGMFAIVVMACVSRALFLIQDFYKLFLL